MRGGVMERGDEPFLAPFHVKRERTRQAHEGQRTRVVRNKQP